MNIETCEMLLDDAGEVSWAQLMAISGFDEAELRELIDAGALTPVAAQATTWQFHAGSIRVVRSAARLRRELDLDTHALALVMRLLARIEGLEARLRAVQAGESAQGKSAG